MSNFVTTDHDMIVLLTPLASAATDWVDQHADGDAPIWGRNCILVEPRSIANIVEGFQNDGLGIAGSAA